MINKHLSLNEAKQLEGKLSLFAALLWHVGSFFTYPCFVCAKPADIETLC